MGKKTSIDSKSLINTIPQGPPRHNTTVMSADLRYWVAFRLQIASQCFVNMQALFLWERLQAVQIWTGLNLTSSLDGATWQPFSTWNRF